MRVVRLTIKNFRGISDAELHFNGHTLLIGGNNVGKSTVCEALDLVLGPDRLNRYPPIEEFDFRNATYLADDGETLVPLKIEAVLVDLSEDVSNMCAANLEFWHEAEQKLLGEGDIEAVDGAAVKPCLRLVTIGNYNIDDDTFEARTIFGRANVDDEEEPRPIPSRVKRALGFLYLRTIRTGSRALSLERGTLLDNILRMKDARKGLWEGIRKRLTTLDPPVDADANELGPILEEIEQRLAEYIAPSGEGRATRLFVSQLTREHLRKTIAFFLTMNDGETPVPFQHAGTGTLNTLVLALLTFIADLKKDNVIFAMEEPEIALPPHTQRRITNYLIEKTSQCFVTSHSPYVIERFETDGIVKLVRQPNGVLSGVPIRLPEGMKAKNYRQNFRRILAEAMLGRGVIVGEGITEQDALFVVAQKLEEADDDLFPLDVAGITIVNAEGDGNLEKLGLFFKEIGIPAFAFFDRKKRTEEELKALNDTYEIACEIKQKGAEMLLATEVPLDRQWAFLAAHRAANPEGEHGIPAERPANDETLKQHTVGVLRGLKGDGGAARLLGTCSVAELPATIKGFLYSVYLLNPRPAKKIALDEPPAAPAIEPVA
ncbi:putative ATP-dependent endonuclease of OLD family [Luteibacter sp. 1214]|uniref:ATP-dependent nuclease n=1 Tax=Luteibacter sp. 1214 TaxID=2817735 RepID=UPI002859CF86|nr:AAA family ATPase [Luteibacter sp. 1214]MDR6640889.1 putative ATP-dependent endonuclease of OLD family [Luteibacter sp. 1214]